MMTITLLLHWHSLQVVVNITRAAGSPYWVPALAQTGAAALSLSELLLKSLSILYFLPTHRPKVLLLGKA
jgi:hypothetical protein